MEAIRTSIRYDGRCEENDGAVGLLTLSEPASLNAMTPDLLGELAAAAKKGVRVENELIKIATVADIEDPNVREAHRQDALVRTDSFTFRSPVNEEELIAAFANFPGGFGQPWQVITLAPIEDFIGTLKSTNRLMMLVIIVLTAIELFFIYTDCRGRSKTCRANCRLSKV